MKYQFRVTIRSIGGEIVDMANDGNCLFRSISHQIYGNPEYHHQLRQKCMDYIYSERDFYQNWIADESLVSYISRLRTDGVWGDHIELQALSELYGRPIQIFAYRSGNYLDLICFYFKFPLKLLTLQVLLLFA